MTWQWADDGLLEPSVPRPKAKPHHVMILIGPAGTGKTSVLKAAEALIDHFAGPESVRKCAISNAAARILRGTHCIRCVACP